MKKKGASLVAYLRKRMMTFLCQKNSNKKAFISFLLLFIFSISAFTDVSSKIKEALSSSPKNIDGFAVYKHLVSKLKDISSDDEQKEVNKFLAEYAIRNSLFENAGEHYLRYYNITPLAKDGKKYLLKALKCFILSGSTTQAYTAYGKLSSIRDTKPSVYDIEGDLYLQYLHLKESLDDPSMDFNSIIHTLKSYSNNPNFAPFKATILFTLWFISNDKEAEDIILRKYPKSMEAMLVKGDVIILPTTFWYLLPSNKTYYDEELTLPSLDSSSTKISIPIAYQIGFFKNREYANAQAKKLSLQGYVVEIKEEKRESGTIYFAVFVIEKENGNVGIRLKNEGYETFPIFE